MQPVSYLIHSSETAPAREHDDAVVRTLNCAYVVEGISTRTESMAVTLRHTSA